MAAAATMAAVWAPQPVATVRVPEPVAAAKDLGANVAFVASSKDAHLVEDARHAPPSPWWHGSARQNLYEVSTSSGGRAKVVLPFFHDSIQYRVEFCDTNSRKRKHDEAVPTQTSHVAEVVATSREMPRLTLERAHLSVLFGSVEALSDAEIDREMTFIYRNPCARAYYSPRLGLASAPSDLAQSLLLRALRSIELGRAPQNLSTLEREWHLLGLVDDDDEYGRGFGTSGDAGNGTGAPDDDNDTGLTYEMAHERALLRVAKSIAASIEARPSLPFRLDGATGAARISPLGMHATLIECAYDREFSVDLATVFGAASESFLVVRTSEWSSMAARLAPLRAEIVVSHETLVIIEDGAPLHVYVWWEMYDLLLRAKPVVKHVVFVVQGVASRRMQDVALSFNAARQQHRLPLEPPAFTTLERLDLGSELPILLHKIAEKSRRRSDDDADGSNVDENTTSLEAVFVRFAQCIEKRRRVPAFLLRDVLEEGGATMPPLVLYDSRGRGALASLVSVLRRHCPDSAAAKVRLVDDENPMRYQFFARGQARHALAAALDAEAPASWRHNKRRCGARGDVLWFPSGAVNGGRVVAKRLDGFQFTMEEDEAFSLECTDVEEVKLYRGPMVDVALVHVASATPRDVLRALAIARTQLVLLGSRIEWARWMRQHFAL